MALMLIVIKQNKVVIDTQYNFNSMSFAIARHEISLRDVFIWDGLLYNEYAALQHKC